MATATTQLSIPPSENLEVIEGIVAECGLMASDGASHFVRAVKMAAGIKALRKVMTDQFMNDWVMPLQGSKLGFRTDKDQQSGYAVNVVRDCAIECLLRGGNLTGNEFNIIAGNTYFTKEFFERVVGEVEGLTDLKLRAGVPAKGVEGALVSYIAEWNMNGKAQCVECLKTKLADGAEFDDRIAIRVNSGMGVDAILGKAKRKILARVYSQATGSNALDGDAEDAVSTLPAPKSLASLTERLKTSDGDGGNGLSAGEIPLDEPVDEAAAEEPKRETQPAAKTTSTEPDDGPTWDDVLADHRNKLAALDSVNDCKRATAQAMELYPDLPAEVRTVFESICTARTDAIRSARGGK